MRLTRSARSPLYRDDFKGRDGSKQVLFLTRHMRLMHEVDVYALRSGSMRIVHSTRGSCDRLMKLFATSFCHDVAKKAG